MKCLFPSAVCWNINEPEGGKKLVANVYAILFIQRLEKYFLQCTLRELCVYHSYLKNISVLMNVKFMKDSASKPEYETCKKTCGYVNWSLDVALNIIKK